MGFEMTDAIRQPVPLMIGLVGPSGSGKTYSALRLATGIGGPVAVIDTEGRRATYYANEFKFKHVNFESPFGSLRYLEAIEFCVSKGAKTIVIDSMSHEHEGPGGMLEQHSAECDRLSKNDPDKRERVKMLAWAQPKADRRTLINRVIQLGVNLILCFRAKEKTKLEGKAIIPLGWQPIGGDEFIFETVASFLLYPGSNGFPAYQPVLESERAIAKLPRQFAALDGKRLDEEFGATMARWSAGGDILPNIEALRASIDTLIELAPEEKRGDIRKASDTDDVRKLLKIETRLKEITQ